MLNLYFATIQPKFIEAYREFGVFSSAMKNKLADVRSINLRDYAVDKHGSIDDYPYGGGDSMVMRPEPIKSAIDSISSTEKPLVVYTSPRGKKWDQKEAQSLLAELTSSKRPLMFLCGRFAGVDQRIIDGYVDHEYSFGDFVISGGELPCLGIADTLLRLVPGVLGNQDSVDNDSFSESMNGGLEYPLYTRPQVFEGAEVPPVLLSGDHEKIAAWRKEQSEKITSEKRPDLI